MTTPKGPVKAPKERTQEDSQNENINPLMPGKEVRELLSEDHSMLSVESLQDNYERIPKAFKEEVIDYLSGAIKEHGENSLFGKKIKNFLQSILPKGKSEKGPTTREIAQKIVDMGIFKTFRDNEAVYFYRDGVYSRNGEMKIKEIVHDLMNGEESSQFCGEVIGKVQRATYTDRSEFTEHSEHKIVLLNGILNLDTLELQGHTPEWLALTKFPVNFKKDAKCPKILKFISEVARSDDIPLLQEWAGYNLWIFGYPAQKAMLLVGDGGNGKSTLIGIIEAMVGRENRSAVSLHELEENRFARHDLYGKAANLYPDLPDKDLKSTGIFKMLTGGDPIRAEDKNVKAFTYHNVAKLTFSCNAVPRVPEDSVAYFRRWLIVEFPYSFEGSNSEDKDLKEKLINDAEEMSGFLNWALDGLQRLRSNGWHFTNGKTVETVREDYIVRSDPYKAFVMHCIAQETEAFVTKQELYEGYRKHCAIHKVTPRSQESFFKNFRYNFPQGALQDEMHILDFDGKPQRKRGFKGIKIRPETAWCIKSDDEGENLSTDDPPLQGDHADHGDQKRDHPAQHDQVREGDHSLRESKNLTFSMDQVRNYIIEILRDEAPKSLYHTFSQREIIEFVRDRYPGIAVGPVYDLIKELYDQGLIYKPNGKNFAYNADGG